MAHRDGQGPAEIRGLWSAAPAVGDPRGEEGRDGTGRRACLPAGVGAARVPRRPRGRPQGWRGDRGGPGGGETNGRDGGLQGGSTPLTHHSTA